MCWGFYVGNPCNFLFFFQRFKQIQVNTSTTDPTAVRVQTLEDHRGITGITMISKIKHIYIYLIYSIIIPWPVISPWNSMTSQVIGRASAYYMWSQWELRRDSQAHIWRCGGFLSHRATPSHHPFIDGIFPEINHPSMGVPPFQETPM